MVRIIRGYGLELRVGWICCELAVVSTYVGCLFSMSSGVPPLFIRLRAASCVYIYQLFYLVEKQRLNP